MKRGQVAVFLAMALVGIVLLALASYRFYTFFAGKMLKQNAIDAASVKVAQYQGELLNEIGRLNLEHLELHPLLGAKVDEIVLRQRQLCLLGPLDAYIAGQAVAGEMGLAPKELNDNNAAWRILMDHARQVVEVYEQGFPYEPSYPGAWGEYVDKLYEAAGAARYMGCANLSFCHFGDHILTEHAFYDAVAARDWCWFYFNAYDYLQNYRDFHDWPELNLKDVIDTLNCEFFSLRLQVRQCALTDVYTKEELARIDPGYNEDMASDPNQYWFFFSGGFMGEWSLIKNGFPAVGAPKPEYDFQGCASACSTCGWMSVARPFGVLDPKGFVLPVFRFARLVPLGTVSGCCNTMDDYDWLVHVRLHVPEYLDHGRLHADKCEWCKQLKTWDRAAFRKHGVWWLKWNKKTCRRGGGGRPMGSGVAHGH